MEVLVQERPLWLEGRDQEVSWMVLEPELVEAPSANPSQEILQGPSPELFGLLPLRDFRRERTVPSFSAFSFRSQLSWKWPPVENCWILKKDQAAAPAAVPAAVEAAMLAAVPPCWSFHK